MSTQGYYWQKAPMARHLPPLSLGMVVQKQWEFSISFITAVICISFFFLLLYAVTRLRSRFAYAPVAGVFIHLTIMMMGCLLLWLNDIRNASHWVGHNTPVDKQLVVELEEPPAEKANSFKSVALIKGYYADHLFNKLAGRVIVYFKKDALPARIGQGSLLTFKKNLQEITPSGNPGAFDYRGYNHSRGITHQVYLTAKDVFILPFGGSDDFRRIVVDLRKWVIHSLRQNIRGKKEQGLAEALLIGYKDDLDKDLVQSYTNTGVIHIIAISGMHLALIYGLLLFMTAPLKKKQLRWLRMPLILSGLWLFTLLAGAGASVVRSAVMFTCIGVAEATSNKASIYNTLSVSAFILLVYHPYWLWDAGFQLSYAAVASIVSFYRPIYHWAYLPNKGLDFLWQTASLSIAAQIVTTPVVLFHFHQFPLLFLFTNLVAVPVSSFILFSEIGICMFYRIEPVANLFGSLSGWLIRLMNTYIQRIEAVSFSVWEGFSLSVLQSGLLLIISISFCCWLMTKKKVLLYSLLIPGLFFIFLRTWSFLTAEKQKKLIIYNTRGLFGMDLVAGRNCNFIGDTELVTNKSKFYFFIRPSRILHRTRVRHALSASCRQFEFFTKKVLVVKTVVQSSTSEQKPLVDVMVLSGKANLQINQLASAFIIRQIVIDGTAPAWKARLWKQQCVALRLPCHDVTANGAFVMNL